MGTVTYLKYGREVQIAFLNPWFKNELVKFKLIQVVLYNWEICISCRVLNLIIKRYFIEVHKSFKNNGVIKNNVHFYIRLFYIYSIQNNSTFLSLTSLLILALYHVPSKRRWKKIKHPLANWTMSKLYLLLHWWS